MRINFLLIALVSSAFASCSSKKERSIQPIETDSVALVKTKEKIFEIDSTTSYQTLFMDIFHDKATNKQYLLYENRIKSTIQFYDYDKGTLAREITLKSEGPDGVGKIRGFYAKSLDSIYVMSSKFYQFVFINGAGNVLNRYRLINKSTAVRDWSMPSIYTSTRPAVLKNIFYFVAYPESKPYFLKQMVLSLDLIDSTTQLHYSYPELYRNGEYWDGFFSHITQTMSHRNSIIYSFGADPYLYETDHAGMDEKHFAGSKYFEETESWDKNISDGSEEGDVARNYYRNILYDPYRGVYYRTTGLKLPPLNVNNETNTLWNKPISIIILDQSFKKIGETLLEPNLYDCRNFVVTADGLLVCNSNPYNPNLQEGKLKFTIFKLEVTKQ